MRVVRLLPPDVAALRLIASRRIARDVGAELRTTLSVERLAGYGLVEAADQVWHLTSLGDQALLRAGHIPDGAEVDVLAREAPLP